MKKTVILALLMSFVFAAAGFAAISFTSRTGNIQITMPDGKVVLVKPDQALPVIPDGASIAIISGTAQISVTHKSHVMVTVGGIQASLDSGDTVNVVVDKANGSGSFSVTKGSVDVKMADGSTAKMNKSSPALQFKAEAYTPPAVTSDVPNVETNVGNEEGARDISPIQ